MEEEFIEIFSPIEFRNWLFLNHIQKKKVGVIIHKKKTGKGSPTHKELMFEAICFGWIDTTLKSLDQDKYVRFFCKRNKNSKWSYNTLKYAKKLLNEGRMSEQGIYFYNEGKKKLPHDYGIPKNPETPNYLIKILKKNNVFEIFQNLSPSSRKNILRNILRAKLQETKNKRIKLLIEELINKRFKKK